MKIEQLLGSLDRSTCNFCAVEEIREKLISEGYKPIDPSKPLGRLEGNKYYFEKNGSAIFAINIGSGIADGAGFRIIAAHSDSPCFKLKPSPEIITSDGTVLLNVEKYGGGIMYTWFDRPLSMSGRVMVKGNNPFSPRQLVFDLREPVAVIPHLAIHFNREVNSGNALSVQKDMKPVVGRFSREELLKFMKEGGVVNSMIAAHLNIDPSEILSSEICLYPVGKPVLAGFHKEYIESGRIDDLSMALTGLYAFLDADADKNQTPQTRVLAVFDNEETGSGTKQGAHSPYLKNMLQRICESVASEQRDLFHRNLHNSFLVSADDAHAYHPNYSEKHDPVNHPVIGGGPAIKINANCKYMTDAQSAAVFAALCDEAGVPYQYFVNHGDVPGGSTLGNILTSQLEIPGVDMGCAIWAMHSACETAGVADHLYTAEVFKLFYLRENIK